jgi:hypothetical protein
MDDEKSHQADDTRRAIMDSLSVVLKSCSNLRRFLGAIAFGTMLAVGAQVAAVEITLEGTQVSDPKVRGYEQLNQSSTSAGPVLVQASTASFWTPNVHTVVRDINGTLVPALDDVGLVFVGTIAEGNGTVYQYFFNKFTFCNAGGTLLYQIDFVNELGSILDATQYTWINCYNV